MQRTQAGAKVAAAASKASDASAQPSSSSSGASSLGASAPARLLFGKNLAEKEGVLDVLYWARQIAAILVGVLWGLFGFTGLVAIIGFGIASTAITIAFLVQIVQVDEDEFGGRWELVKEGFMPSFSLFLVSWIVAYTGVHF
ncbi:hypothetical protein CAOG_01374 [Capsaspora owczarzaki ATCC 30864]|uniref:hypothetical protein n=1 Tax=Capsaspora owczarzaki (strain ATCC 30864) TaxID=595528 RepID=UPI0001FE2E04|nr:hypothetical protein CAOG_01374 [Capsaspora owczarzaki ATCC 30864]|eukprot:XP_004349894.1 hypothetical protein CAOG_01374 [Capsaspora owczarzaki ATCC 30864]